MNISDTQAIILQNLRAASCMTSNDSSGTWAQTMLFDDGSTVLIRGTHRGHGPGLFDDALYGTKSGPLEPITEATYLSLVERYYKKR